MSMPPERASVTHRFRIAGSKDYFPEGLKGFITVGLREDGTPGEVFLKTSKLGSIESGLLHTIALLISLALQQGVSLQTIVDTMSHMKFEPAGVTGNPKIPIAASVVDYIGRWLKFRFLV